MSNARPRSPAAWPIAVFVVLVASACATAVGSPVASAGSSVAPSPLASPTASSSASPAAIRSTPTLEPSPADAVGFHPNSFVQVVTDDLRVRTLPGVGSDSLKLEPLLWDGAMAMVLDGPVTASGYDWYLVRLLSEVDLQFHPDPPPFGWVAAAAPDGEPWLASFPIDCHETPLDWLIYDFHQPPIELAWLSCFADSTRSFTASLGRVDIDCPDGDIRPRAAWLDACGPGYALASEGGLGPDGDRYMTVAVHPDAGVEALPPVEPGSWLVVNVEGQYDHPAASECQSADPGVPAQVASLGCRATFVVTAISVYADQ